MHLVFILKLKVSTCLEDKKRLINAVFIFFGPEAECKLSFYYFKEDTMSITCAKQIFTLFSRRDDLLLKSCSCLFCLLNNFHLSSHLSHSGAALKPLRWKFHT